VAPPTPQQQQRRAAFERLIGIAAPFLDLVLVAGERVSRIVSPEDDYIPIRSPAEAFELARGRPARSQGSSRREIAD
jgi:hypothetical protein